MKPLPLFAVALALSLAGVGALAVARAGHVHHECTVIGVPDGDSLKVTCTDRKSAMSVRLLEVDAPELAHPAFHIVEQPWGRESRAALTALCLKKPAVVHATSIDRYGRTLAHVECAGVDVNAEQVRAGNAWAYMPKRGSTLPKLQAAAQAGHAGLWSLPAPVRPSEWRAGHPG
jgi:endonuclease YncB( thermonuclease family)